MGLDPSNDQYRTAVRRLEDDRGQAHKRHVSKRHRSL
jgi:hypothetical protein